MTNREIAKILMEMAELYEMEGVMFKPRAYEKASLVVEAQDIDVTEIYKKGGKDALKKIPVNISELSAVEGVGPKMIKVLYQKLKIKNLKDLERAAVFGKIRKLERFGLKSEEKILKGIEFLKKSGGRRVFGLIFPEIRGLERMIRAFPEVEKAVVAGSTRRRKETIGDIEILAISVKD